MEPPLINEVDKLSDPNEDEGFYESMKIRQIWHQEVKFYR